MTMKNTIAFRTHDQKVLWDHEISGQLSDGYWENATPRGHWEVWCRAETVVDPDNVGRNFRAARGNYNLAVKDLLNIVSGRMIVTVQIAQAFGAEHVDTVRHLFEACGQAWVGMPEYKGQYWDDIRSKITALAETLGMDYTAFADKVAAVNYTERELKRDLKEMMRTIRFYNAELIAA